MKVNEFQKIEEALFSDLMGLIPDANISRKANPKNIQQLYLKDFIEDLMVDMESAIKGGAINFDVSSSSYTPRQAVQPTDQTRQDALQRSAQRKQQHEPKQSISDPEEELSGIADLGYNENYYSKLNTIVESLIQEENEQSMSNWIMRWYEAYMKGIDWSKTKPQVEQLAKQIEKTYSKDKGKNIIQQLAKISWDTTFKAKGIPKGAEDVYQSQRRTGSSNIPKDELQALEKLRTADAKKYLDMLKQAGIKK